MSRQFWDSVHQALLTSTLIKRSRLEKPMTFGIWKEKNEEMRFGRKLEGNSTILKEKGRKSYNLNSFQ